MYLLYMSLLSSLRPTITTLGEIAPLSKIVAISLRSTITILSEVASLSEIVSYITLAPLDYTCLRPQSVDTIVNASCLTLEEFIRSYS